MAPGQIMVREAGGTVSGFDGNDDPLKTGDMICGNEAIHGELVKILMSDDGGGLEAAGRRSRRRFW